MRLRPLGTGLPSAAVKPGVTDTPGPPQSDLIIGQAERSTIATVVERMSRYTTP